MTTEKTPDVVFNAFVPLTDLDGHLHTFRPGDPIPDWALPMVGEHVKADPGDVIETTTPAGTPEQFYYDAHPEERPTQPPTSGPGSSRDAWAEFAAAVGQYVPDAWTRQDIQDALIRGGYLTDDE